MAKRKNKKKKRSYSSENSTLLAAKGKYYRKKCLSQLKKNQIKRKAPLITMMQNKIQSNFWEKSTQIIQKVRNKMKKE